MTKYINLFSDELIEWLIEEVFVQYQCQMSIYYKYAPYGAKLVVISYVDDFFYCCTSEALGKWFVGTIRKRLHVNFFRYAYLFISIMIPQMKHHSISVYQDRYATYIVAKYLYTSIFKTST